MAMSPFPLTIAGVLFSSPAALRERVEAELRRGRSPLVEGQSPAVWLANAVRTGEMSHALCRSLAAALLSGGRYREVVEAARLAVLLDMGELAPMLHHAVEGLDVALLLRRVAVGRDDSVEDELLRAWAAIEPGEDPLRVAALLRRLREAGLRALEIQVLGRSGTPELVEEHLPPILEEPLGSADVEALASLLIRGALVREVASAHAFAFAPEERGEVWRAALSRAPELALDAEMVALWRA